MMVRKHRGVIGESKAHRPEADAASSVAGFVGYADGQLKMPPAWIRTNVVKLKRA